MEEDVNTIYNNFVNTYIRIWHSSIVCRWHKCYIWSSNVTEFKNVLSHVINDIVTWCKNNLLTLNLEKKHNLCNPSLIIKKIDTHVIVMDSVIRNSTSIKFLGLLLDNKLMWKAYSRELAIKLNKACYTIRAIKSLVSLKALISIYFPTSIHYWCMVLYFGVIPSSVRISLKFKREQLELSLINVGVKLVNIFLNDWKY